MSVEFGRLAAVHAKAKAWSLNHALPLWATTGFDTEAGIFEEQLDFSHAVVTTIPRRAMVQARQIAVYASAALDGWYPQGATLAIRACDSLLAQFWAADGKPGFVFSLNRNGSVADARRDLYAHAFVLFALAWRSRLGRTDAVEAAVVRIIAYLRSDFAADDGEGFISTLPRPDAIRRQNPHMHLIEAALELQEATGNPEAAKLADEVRALATSRLIQRESGALLEYFTDSWALDEKVGAPARTEPGHQMEWAWILRRHEEIVGGADRGQVGPLIDFALSHGIDATTGRVIDETDGEGRITKSSSRSWPHTETVKALARECAAGRRLEALPVLERVYARLFNSYCSDELQGGWIDQRDEADQPVSRIMPASTLYHVHLAIREVERLLAVAARR